MTSSGFELGPPAGPAFDVQAALSLEIDGRAASITGSGNRLVLHLDSPGHTLHAARSFTSSAVVGTVANMLRAAGLRLDVVGAHGQLLSLGAGVDSVLGRLGTGSRAVSAGSPRAVTYLAVQLLQRATGRRRAAAVAGLTGAVLVAAALASAMNNRLSRGRHIRQEEPYPLTHEQRRRRRRCWRIGLDGLAVVEGAEWSARRGWITSALARAEPAHLLSTSRSSGA